MSSQLQLAEKMPNLNNVMMGLNDDDAPMTTAIVEQQPPAPKSIFERIERKTAGLVLPADITPAEWLQVGEWLATADRWLQFMIGDWINGAKPEWGWGHIYEQAHKLFPKYTPETLRNISSVAANIDLSFRNDKVPTYTHFVHLSRLTEAKMIELIDRIIAEDLSVSELKAIIAERIRVLPSSTQVADREWVLAKLTKLRAGAMQAIVKGDEVTTVFYEQMKADTDELMGRIKALVTD